jgi:hypothetical protein
MRVVCIISILKIILFLQKNIKYDCYYETSMENLSRDELIQKVLALEGENSKLKKMIANLQTDMRVFVPPVERIKKKRKLPAIQKNQTPKCCFCMKRVLGVPKNYPCWTLSAKMNQWLEVNEDDFKKAIRRLNGDTDRYGEPPQDFEEFQTEATDSQIRLTLYYKVFRYFHDKGEAGKRVFLPECIVMKIRNEFPEGRSDFDFDEIVG